MGICSFGFRITNPSLNDKWLIASPNRSVNHSGVEGDTNAQGRLKVHVIAGDFFVQWHSHADRLIVALRAPVVESTRDSLTPVSPARPCFFVKYV
jgi:hypothetical protein